ncbi:MAG: hypothetical protein RIC95_05965 [Vicingaceae bacterium]
MKKVVWTPVALESLAQTKDFLDKVWNDEVIDSFLNKLDHRINQIRKNPELAPSFKQSEFRQLIVHRTTSLFYRIYPDHIKLLLLWDNRQNPSDLLKKINDANNK